jgi:hypothetical protein
MGDPEPANDLEPMASAWMTAFEQKRFHDALLLGFAWYLSSHEMKDEDGRNGALVAMRGAAEALLPVKERKDECSFCGLRPPEVRLAAGPDAFICAPCVALLSEAFSESDTAAPQS